MKIQQRCIFIALALVVGVMAVLVTAVIFPGVRPKVKPVRITARNYISQFSASVPLPAANQNAVGGSSNATPGLVGE